MKLQKRFAYKYKNKEHYKHVLVIPAGSLEKLGWKSGEVLKPRIENGALIIESDQVKNNPEHLSAKKLNKGIE